MRLLILRRAFEKAAISRHSSRESSMSSSGSAPTVAMLQDVQEVDLLNLYFYLSTLSSIMVRHGHVKKQR
jgi:hypothetical protein